MPARARKKAATGCRERMGSSGGGRGGVDGGGDGAAEWRRGGAAAWWRGVVVGLVTAVVATEAGQGAGPRCADFCWAG
jgi:hypothetical protein